MSEQIKGVKYIGLPFIGPEPRGACFDPDQSYRYTLWRKWEAKCLRHEMVAFIGLNPSTADEDNDDPTVTRCINFAKGWGFKGMVMLNLFAFRATDPRDMKANKRPQGPKNDDAIFGVAESIGQVVTCWGVHGAWANRGSNILGRLRAHCNLKTVHLGLTKEGHPRHPLYLRSDTPRQFWGAIK